MYGINSCFWPFFDLVVGFYAANVAFMDEVLGGAKVVRMASAYVMVRFIEAT